MAGQGHPVAIGARSTDIDTEAPPDVAGSPPSEDGAARRAQRDKLVVTALVFLFIVTRFTFAVLATRDDIYQGDTHVVGDVILYDGWASQIEAGARAYTDLRVEYPPGGILTMLVPEFLSDELDGYLAVFVLFAVAVDALAFTAVLREGRRRATFLGPLLWALTVPALGAIAYTRLDLFVGVVTLLMLVALLRGRALLGGFALGLGVAVKLYPAAFAPTVVMRTRAKTLAGIGALGGVLLPVLFFVGQGSAMYDAVFGYHTERGIQVESSWGLLSILTSDVVPGYTFGAFHVATSAEGAFKLIASASIVIAGLVQLIPWLRKERLDAANPAELARYPLVAILLMVTLSTVFSPQYLLWIAPIAAVYVLDRKAALRRTITAVVVAAAVVTQFAYPFHYNALLEGQTPLTLLLLARNVALLSLAVALVAVREQRTV